MNIYKKILKQNLNRLLSCYDMDVFSATYGYGDREFWGWKTKDFSNGTLQGGVHSLAVALRLDLFSSDEKKIVLKTIDAAIMAVPNVAYSNGSLAESYPQENSFCVTALVAFDVLSALFHLKEDLNIQPYFDVVRPLIEFISKHDEEHAIISNHLATAVAAVTLWNDLTGENNNRGIELLETIYNNQSEEGWYKEYDGADPGYQTLCTYYLYCVYQVTHDQRLKQSLEKSAAFLKNFIHPDQTIGGLYGSRNTEVFYPAGIIGLSKCIDDFALMAKFLEPKEQHILPDVIDMGNLIPLLNSYAVAALSYENTKKAIDGCKQKPFYQKIDQQDFSDAGVFIYSNEFYFVVVNYKKGGTIKAFNKETQKVFEDGGLFGVLKNNKKFSTQVYDDRNRFDDFCVCSDFYLINQGTPNPITFIILRALSLTVFRSVRLGEIFKKFIVKKLMTGKNKIDGNVTRKFVFKKKKIEVEETIVYPKNTRSIKHLGKVKSIHMASSGYFSQQQFKKNKELVEFKERK